MKQSIFRAMLALSLLMLSLTLGGSYFLPRNLTTLLWMFPLLLLVGAGLSQLLARHMTRCVVKTLEGAGLEDLERQGLYEELRPLACHMLEQSRQIKKQLQRQNSQLRREYEKQDRMRRDFTANVSHELKTPLTSISGYAEILRDGLVKKEDIPRFAGKIYNETQRLIALVEDILKLSQLEEGPRVPLKREPVELYGLCQEVLTRLQGAAEQRGIFLSLQGQTGFIIGVSKIVEEIVYNLVENAIKYNTPQGAVVVSLQEIGDKLVLSVKDSGIGISKEEQARVFERFYRVDKSHSKEIGGTGLGLSIVKHGALYHDARIELSSVPSEGTEFRVLFHKGSPVESEVTSCT